MLSLTLATVLPNLLGMKLFTKIAIGLATAGMLSIATTIDVATAEFEASTGELSQIESGSLTGNNAPASGVDTFVAYGNGSGCSLLWSQLKGGNSVAERVTIVDSTSGDEVMFQSPSAPVAPGSTTTTTIYNDSAASHSRRYTMVTKRATTWISPADENRTTTCVNDSIVSVSAGDRSSCAIRSDRTLWCWGFGADGVGGRTDRTTTATPVGGPFNDAAMAWRTVDVGGWHTCGIDVAGALYCFGNGGSGRLGNGTVNTTSYTAARVGVANNWLSVSAASSSSCALNDARQLWCWGANTEGVLGTGTFNAYEASPVRVDATHDWVYVDGSRHHMCAITTAAELYCWGDNDFAQLGVGDSFDRPTPTRVGTASDWVQVSAGQSHTCALNKGAEVWCWGAEASSAAGDPVSSSTPLRLTGDGWTSVHTGRQTTCAIDAIEQMWCRGSNAFNATGVGTSDEFLASWTKVDGIAWKQISMGERHSCGVDTSNGVRCWGNAGVGGTGAGDSPGQNFTTTAIADNWQQVSLSDHHSCAVSTSGDLACWGANEYGQLGDEIAPGIARRFERRSPIPPWVRPDLTWAAVSAGGAHTCAITAVPTGHLYCWGANWAGQVGPGGFSPSQAPQRIGGDTWLKVSAGLESTCGITSTQALKCWGSNSRGQLGIATADTHAVLPTDVAESGPWLDVSVGENHACAIKVAGGVWCWGDRSVGQTGQPSSADPPDRAPIRVTSDIYTDWTSVSVGDLFSCALRSVGELYCWGANSSGQLARASAGTTYAAARADAGPLAGVAIEEFSAGSRHACARSNTDLYCWGQNFSGQLGSLPRIAANSPTLVATTRDATTLPTPLGKFYGCYINASARLVCSGDNAAGQAGVWLSTPTPTAVDAAPSWLG